jgi:sialic acid synthase SpsE
MLTEFRLGSKLVGAEHPPYFIADIAANHDGDLNRAKLLIELAAESGANAAKFQHFRASTIVSKHGFEELGKKIAHQEKWEKDVFQVYESAEVPWSWTIELASHSRKCGIDFFTAPYDLEAINFVDDHVVAYKVGSGDIDWIEAVELMASKGKPMIIATGASAIEDVDRAVSASLAINSKLVLMQCNTNYTGDNENLRHLNLNVLKEYAFKYKAAILGLSDHTPGDASVLGAIALGARVIEKHFTDDVLRSGPDHAFSMDAKSWRKMITNAQSVFYALGDGIKKIEVNESESSIVQRRALRFMSNLPTGHTITRSDLIPLRPCPSGSFKPYQISEVVGKKLKIGVLADSLVTPDVLE